MYCLIISMIQNLKLKRVDLITFTSWLGHMVGKTVASSRAWNLWMRLQTNSWWHYSKLFIISWIYNYLFYFFLCSQFKDGTISVIYLYRLFHWVLKAMVFEWTLWFHGFPLNHHKKMSGRVSSPCIRHLCTLTHNTNIIIVEIFMSCF